MEILATRTLSYLDESSNEKELVLTIFVPIADEGKDPTCAHTFGPPLNAKIRHAPGSDSICAIARCLEGAQAIRKTYTVGRQARWKGMADCGLIESAERPVSWAPPAIPPPVESPGNMDVLTTRRLHGQEEHGAGTELLLTLFVPFKAEGDEWRCGFTFGQPGSEGIRYGIGEDYIEALLDSFAMARVVYESRVPKDWGWMDDLQDCSDLPYKIGRAFRIDRRPRSSP